MANSKPSLTAAQAELLNEHGGFLAQMQLIRRSNYDPQAKATLKALRAAERAKPVPIATKIAVSLSLLVFGLAATGRPRSQGGGFGAPLSKTTVSWEMQSHQHFPKAFPSSRCDT